MKALTVRQPWAWAIAHAGKDIENRTWAPRSVIGQRIAIHVGIVLPPIDGPDMDALVDILGIDGTDELPLEEVFIQGAIIAVTTVYGWCSKKGHEPYSKRQAMIDQITLNRWAAGPICWMLRDTVALKEQELIFCGGKQGLWTIGNREFAMLRELGVTNL